MVDEFVCPLKHLIETLTFCFGSGQTEFVNGFQGQDFLQKMLKKQSD